MKSIPARWRSMRWPLVALFVGILGVTVAAIRYDIARHRETAAARLVLLQINHFRAFRQDGSWCVGQQRFACGHKGCVGN